MEKEDIRKCSKRSAEVPLAELSMVLETKDIQTFDILLSEFLKKLEDIPEFFRYFLSEYAEPNCTSKWMTK